MKNFLTSLMLIIPLSNCLSQSIEIMPGSKRIFIDLQWLKPFDDKYKWTLFARSRATAEYGNNNTNLFTGAYLNYTSKTGVGGTLLGRVSTTSSGLDLGVHYFKNGKNFMIYALPAIALKSDLSYSWFSIVRYTPKLTDTWILYTSLELFSNFNTSGHIASVQRVRLGSDYRDWQFGLALNLAGIGKNYENKDTNPGIFVRKTFD